jgi:glycosyltransferase involved in cell wall biosynthesis
MTMSDGKSSALSVPNVVISMLTLVPGEMGGSETYVSSLLQELDDMSSVNVSTLFPRPYDDGSSPKARTLISTIPGRSAAHRVRTLAKTFRSRPGRRHIRAADLVHYPFSIPTPQPVASVPYVQTIHDVQHRDMPQLFSKSERAFRRLAYDLPATRASAIITISQFSKSRIVSALDVDPDKVHVAYLGHRAPAVSPNLGEREDFLLYPARMWPHKNHGRLIEAVALLRNERRTLRLVLTGDPNGPRVAMPAWVENRGLVSRGELDDLYRRTSCLVFPSLYEGFGLPPLEAMAAGCPTAVAASGALPEVCGSASAYFDPHHPADIARGIAQALSDSSRLSALGPEHAASFSWKRCAEAHVTVYSAVAGLPVLPEEQPNSPTV